MHTISSYNSESTRPLYRGVQIVWFVLGIIESMLAIRFVLKLLGANPNTEFSNFIYGITYPLTEPFLGVFSQPRLEGRVFEWSTLLAMAVYWLIAYGIIRLLLMSKAVSTREAAQKLHEEEEK